MERTQIFVSYSQQDKPWLERLQVHLAPLVREGKIDLWDDTRVQPGAILEEELARALASARVVILLVSAQYLASEFLASEHWHLLLKRAEEKGVVILSVLISASLFEELPELARFKSFNAPDAPLNSLPAAEQESQLADLAEIVMRLTEEGADLATLLEKHQRELLAAAHEARQTPDAALETRKLTAVFAPERYTYIALILIAAVVFFFCLYQMTIPESASMRSLVPPMLGSGGAAFFCMGRLQKVFDQTRQIINHQLGLNLSTS